MCNQLINTLKKGEKLEEKYPWLDNMDERKYMSNREILEKYIYLSNTYLQKEEKEEDMDMLYKYKEALSLRDDTGTCPNKEVEINMTDKAPFSIRPYHVGEEDKKVLDKEMKCLCYLGILNKEFSPYLSPVMLIS